MKNNVIEKVWKNSLETCEYLGGYKNSTSTIRVRCIKHNYEFETKYENHNVELLDTLLLVLYEEYTIEGFNYVVDAFNLI